MRRSKTSLLLMEQMVTLLIFALAAAVCLQAFVKADALSRDMEAQDRAAVLCQNAAETIQYTAGDFSRAAIRLGGQSQDKDSLMTDYGRDWKPATDAVRYIVGAARLDSGVPGLGKAVVWCRDEGDDDGRELFRMEFAWQEVDGDG